MDGLDLVERLSAQQRRCLRLVGQGKSTAQIAFELGIAEGTVNGHIVAGMAKLGSATRRQAGYLVVAAEAATQQFHTRQNHRVGDDTFVRPSPLSSSVREDNVGYQAAPRAELPGGGQARGTPTKPLQTIVLVVVLVVALLIVLLALKPLVESARDLANVIQPGGQH